MSINRIVEGDLVNTSASMKLSANYGDYQFNSPSKNQWKGDENGIIEDDYKPPHKDDVLANSINVNLNLFFDGTQNNKTNTEAKKTDSSDHDAYIKEGNKNDDSFENDYTNIARGYDAIDPDAENQVAVYIEGIGTENLKSDSIIKGVAQGEGDTGIEAKVSKGCMDAAVSMRKKNYHIKNIDILYVNVYGFSRGAAAARHFIHVASKMAEYWKLKKIAENKYKYHVNPDYLFSDSKYQIDLTLENTSFIDRYGYFGACLLYKEIKTKKIVFNFIGIYDTVASHGLYHGNDVSDLKLDSITKANYVFHIASDDEYRENFDLSNIKSAGLRGLELTLPGVHSDIGGSYLNNMDELSVIANLQITDEDNDEQRRIAEKQKNKEYDAFKKIVADEGWYWDDQLKKQFFHEKDFDKFTGWYENHFNYGLVGRRKLFNTYDKIPLNLMIEKSKSFKVIYSTRLLKRAEITDDFISTIYDQLKAYINDCVLLRNKYVETFNENKTNFSSLSKEYTDKLEKMHYNKYVGLADLKKLRNKYLHWSVKSNLLGLSARKEGALPQEQRKREIHNG